MAKYVSMKQCSRLLLVAFFAHTLLFGVSGAAAAFKNLTVGDQALPLELEDLEGEKRSLADYQEARGRLLVFWASWSERSLRQLDDLVRLQELYGGQGLQVIAVNAENQQLSFEELVSIRALAEEKGVNFPVLLDRGLESFNAYGVMALPTTALLDAEGNIVFELSSYPSSAPYDQEEAVKRVLGLLQEEEASVEKAEPAYLPDRKAMLHLGLGRRLADKGFTDKAMVELSKAAEADSGYSEPRLLMGYLQLKLESYPEAQASLEHALALEAGRWDTTLLLARALLGVDRTVEALELLAPVSAEGEEAPPVPEGVAQAAVLLAEGNADGAREALLGWLGGALEEAGFPLEEGVKELSPMEKMRLMMEKKGA